MRISRAVSSDKISQRKPEGFLLVSLLITTFLILAIGTSVGELVVQNYKLASSEIHRLHAQMAADAGADYAIQEFNNDPAWTGTGGEFTLRDSDGLRLAFESTVTGTSDPQKKIVTVTGRSYASSFGTEPMSERKIEVVLQGVGGSGVDGSFAVVSGVGGLMMDHGAKVINGEVYVNGTIILEHGAQIGTSSDPVNVKTAHQSCPDPPDGTYPRVCGSGENGQPISLLHGSHIYGEVRATNQTDGAGMSDPGLVADSVVEPALLPGHDRTAFTSGFTAAITQSGSQASCDDEAKIWPANLEIVGDVVVEDDCFLTIEGNVKVTGELVIDDYSDVIVGGNVWVTDFLHVDHHSNVIVSDILSSPPEIVVDGQEGFVIDHDSSLLPNGNSVGFRVLTYWSAASCSPDCADVTGAALYDSQDVQTIHIDHGANAPKTQFYARWSQVTLEHQGEVGALVGQTIMLDNQSIVSFGLDTEESSGSGNLAWIVESYKRIFD